ncbi:J domain-containing protein [Jiangella endophytica]|uniref:J domain-containing protein n=1 Tax=Jiangella endophytica TaxID=1623398 RepID=UPI0018E56F85|nr:J domain-containing protein [Jiangella endophytica]
MADLDYYELLDVAPTATLAEIREAYRRAVRSAHPDVGGTSGMFRLVTAAYETLSDPARRADYDARLGTPGRGHRADEWSAASGPSTQPGPESAEADAGWGEEATWTAEDGRPDQAFESEGYVPRRVDRRGVTMLMLVACATGVIFVLGTLLLLYDPGFMRPGEAGSDLLSWYDGQPVLRLIVMLVYVILLGAARSESAAGLLFAHVLFSAFLLAWPIAYWDLASAAEQWVYVVGVVVWLTYNGLLVGLWIVVGRWDEARVFRDTSGTSEVSDLTRWARTDAGGRAVRAGYIVIGATFVFLAVVLIDAHGLIRPAAAGPDALDVALRFPVAVAIVVAIYGYIAYISIGHRSGLELIYVPVAVGLLAWPLAYWDIATTSERWFFGLVALAWALHVGAQYATSSLIDRRRPTPEWTR